MAIIIGDIHGNLEMSRAFLAYKPADEHIALGDLVDSRNPAITADQELACLDLLLESGAVLLWGNHDLAYLPQIPWRLPPRFPSLHRHLSQRFRSAAETGRIKAAHAADGWLCTHAGLSTVLTDLLPAAPWNSGNVPAMAAWLNAEFRRLITTPGGPLFAASWARGGSDSYGGIFWYDPRWEPTLPDPRMRQIFGHTPTPEPIRRDTWIDIDMEDRYVVFDTEEDDFVQMKKEG